VSLRGLAFDDIFGFNQAAETLMEMILRNRAHFGQERDDSLRACLATHGGHLNLEGSKRVAGVLCTD
jgi:hypothetical protein